MLGLIEKLLNGCFPSQQEISKRLRGELSSRSMVETSASAIAWSDTARPCSIDLLSDKMVDPTDKDNQLFVREKTEPKPLKG